jgi:hypothetical protein
MCCLVSFPLYGWASKRRSYPTFANCLEFFSCIQVFPANPIN